MKQPTCLFFLLCLTLTIFGQNDLSNAFEKKRLDFAKTYFEIGGNYTPSFTGKLLANNEVINFENAEALNTTLYWGGFHFWGHAEFYVSFPLHQLNLSSNEKAVTQFTHYAVTGARFLPWSIEEKKLRPYMGISWSALEFSQKEKPDGHQPKLEKNFTPVFDVGILYGYKNFAARLGLNYFTDNTWNYAITETNFQEIETPKYSLQLGLIYTMDNTKKTGDPELNKNWNNFPVVSNLGLNAKSIGDFFVGVGPSISFSLKAPKYNTDKFPYLNKQQASSGYFDIAFGYQFNKASMFTTLSFRNPTFEQTAYETKQTLQKTSLSLEIAKFLTDYTGFAPFLGMNLAYDKINYSETTTATNKALTYHKIEPGIIFGWDIVPGKSAEALILRTNLRWYPFSSIQIEDKKFNLSQLEYNLIQVVFYPGRLKRKKK